MFGRIGFVVAVALLFSGFESVALAQVLFQGFVRDGSGQEVVGADLDFFDAESGVKVDPFVPGSSENDNTDAFGVYSMEVIPGVYHVRYEPPVDRVDLAPVLLRDVRITETVLLDVVLPRGARLTGTVRDEAGAPVPGVDLDFIDASTGVKAATVGDDTNNQGRFDVRVVPGTYHVEWKPSALLPVAPVRVESLTLSDSLDYSLTLPRGYLIEVDVFDFLGRGVPGADADVIDAATGRQLPLADDESDFGGALAFRVPAGSVHVFIEPPRGYPIVSGVFHDVAVADDVDLGRIDLIEGHLWEGIVRDGKGDFLAGADIDLRVTGTGQPYPASPVGVTDTGGRFEVRLVPGTYDMSIAAPESLGLDTLHILAFSIETDTVSLFSFEPEGPEEVAIQAFVRDESGMPVSGATVRGVLEDLVIWTAITNSEGMFEALVTAGRYTIEVEPPPDSKLRPLSLDDVLVPDSLPGTLVLPNAPSFESASLRCLPNPIVDVGTVQFDAPAGGERLTLDLYDIAGRRVRRLHDERFQAGTNRFEVETGAGDPVLSPGLYFLRATLPGETLTFKVVVF
ncbi:MAG: hypothetical protein HKN20_12415 [Gemmatimonadetes bacterium]|nr:hypothetical protein [Gemmatimonadota bacterium]